MKELKNLKSQKFTEGEGEEELYYRFKEFSDNPGFPENWTIGQESQFNNRWVIRNQNEIFVDYNLTLKGVLKTGLEIVRILNS